MYLVTLMCHFEASSLCANALKRLYSVVTSSNHAAVESYVRANDFLINSI